MNKCFFPFVFAFILFSFIVSVSAAPPNIIYVLADDMGYGDVSVLNPEGKIKTVQLDKLASEGMVFEDMHSPSSVCTPTRYGILSGRYNWRSSLKNGVLGGYSPPLIERDRLTLPAMLKEEGYHTAVIGKWHLGLDWASKEPSTKKTPDESNVDFSRPFEQGPLSYGFDYFFGISASLDMPPFVFLENDRATEIPTTRKKWVREGAAAESFEAIDVLPKLTEKAIGYIESRAEEAKAGNPFFLYFPLNAPHTPILPSEQWKGKSELGNYGDFVMEVDDTLGRIVATVDRLGLGEDTIIIFTADNGFAPAADVTPLLQKRHNPSGTLRGYKADIFDGGHRVPFIVRWPGKIAPGSKSDQLGCLLDLMRTCSDILGKQLPDDAAEDSVSLLPAMLQTASGPLRSEVVHHSINGSFAIRKGGWKLCLCPDSGGWSDPKPGSEKAKNLPEYQLYDMLSDIGETRNLEESEKSRIEEMENSLRKIVQDGRSTPGSPQKNTGAVRIRK